MDTQQIDLLSLQDTATYMQCCLRTVFRRIAAGQLVTVREDRRVYVTRASADAFLKSRFDRLYSQVK